MEREFAPSQEALVLKELGFDEPCFGLYYGTSIKEEPEFLLEFRSSQYYVAKGYVDGILAPTFSQAFRFFREKYNIEVAVACFYSKRLNILYEERQYHCHVIRDGVTSKGPKYKTYEKAELECLKKLIQIVKEK